MIIQELKPSKRVRGRWLAVLEDGSLLRVGEGEVLQFSLCAGRELTEEEAERLLAAVRTGGLKEKALNLLAGRPMSRRRSSGGVSPSFLARKASMASAGSSARSKASSHSSRGTPRRYSSCRSFRRPYPLAE